MSQEDEKVTVIENTLSAREPYDKPYTYPHSIIITKEHAEALLAGKQLALFEDHWDSDGSFEELPLFISTSEPVDDIPKPKSIYDDLKKEVPNCGVLVYDPALGTCGYSDYRKVLEDTECKK